MVKFVKGIIVGSVIGMAVGTMLDFSNVTCCAKKYIKKGKRLLRTLI